MLKPLKLATVSTRYMKQIQKIYTSFLFQVPQQTTPWLTAVIRSFLKTFDSAVCKMCEFDTKLGLLTKNMGFFCGTNKRVIGIVCFLAYDCFRDSASSCVLKIVLVFCFDKLIKIFIKTYWLSLWLLWRRKWDGRHLT